MSAISVFSDAYNGFGGLASSLLEEIYDEYSGTCIVGFISGRPERIAASSEQSMEDDTGNALCLASMLETAQLIIPAEPSNVIASTLPLQDHASKTCALRRSARICIVNHKFINT